MYGVGGYANTIKRRDRSFRMKLADGEGTSHSLILTADMLEIMRKWRRLRIRQAEMQEELKRETMEYEKTMWVSNEHAWGFE